MRGWFEHDEPPAWFVILVAIGQAVAVAILRRISEGMQ